MVDFLKNNPSLALDGLLILILFIYAIKGYLDGMLASIVGLIGNLGSLVAAGYVSKTYSEPFFDQFLYNSMVKRSFNYLQQTSQNIDIKTALDAIIGKAPNFLIEEIINKAQVAVTQLLEPTEESAIMLVNDFIRPVIVPCIAIVWFVLVFAAVKIVCGLLRGIFKKMNDIPVLGTANKLTGFVIGIIIGCINIILLSFLLSIIILVSGDSMNYVNSAVVSGSKIMALTRIINPFLP